MAADDVWDRFLTDTEERIRLSAPREPAASERVPAQVTPAAAARRGSGRRSGRARRYVRPVLVLLLVAALALLTFDPSFALSWVDGLLGRGAVGKP